RYDGLRADALIAAGDAVEFERRARPELFDDRAARFACCCLEADGAEECVASEPKRLPLRQLLRRRISDAVIEARYGDTAAVIVERRHDFRERPNWVRHRSAIDAGMEIAVGSADHEFITGEAAQHRRDGRRILVPLAGVADENEIGFEFIAVRGEKARQRRRTALFLAFDQ